MVEAWGALADAIAAPPALHPGYVRAWAAAHADPERLRAVTVWRGHRLAAVLPLVTDRSRLTTIALRDTEETGIVADGDDAALAAAQGALALGFARVLLRPVPRDGPTRAALAGACAGGAGMLLERTIDEHPVIDIAGDWDAYWRGLSRNTRSDIARRRRRLAELGRVNVEVLDGTDGLDRALDVAFAIEASGWKGRAGTALAARPADERHHRLLAGWAARRGWFRLSFLRLDGRAIAFHYSLQAHGVLYALKIGFADDMSAHSPGKLLMAAEIERAFAEGLGRFDFAGSAADYKTRWANGSRTLVELSAFPAHRAGAERPRRRPGPRAAHAGRQARQGGAARRTPARPEAPQPELSPRQASMIVAAVAAHEKRVRESSRAWAPIRSAASGSSTSARIAAASSSGRRGATTKPLSPSSTTSGSPPTRVAMTGRPWAYATCSAPLAVALR